MEPKSVETTVTMVCSTETIYTRKIIPLIHILGCNDSFLICVPLVPRWPTGSLRVRTQEFTGSCFLNVFQDCQHTEHCWMKSDNVLLLTGIYIRTSCKKGKHSTFSMVSSPPLPKGENSLSMSPYAVCTDFGSGGPTLLCLQVRAYWRHPFLSDLLYQ